MLAKMKNISWLPLASLLALGILWGSGYSIAHYATTHNVPPLGYAFWQSVGPAICLFLLMLLLRRKICLRPASILLYVFSGAIGIALPNSIIYFTAAHLPAGLLAVVVNTVPLFTFIIALLLAEEKFNYIRILAVASCMLGLAILLLPGHNLLSELSKHMLFLALLSPLCFASCAVVIARYQPKTCSPMSLATGMLFFASLWLIPVVVYEHGFYAFSLPLHMRDFAIMIEIILSSLGYIIFCYLLRAAGSVYYSMVGGVVAIVGLIWGRLLFSESFTNSQWLAIVFIILSIFLLSCYRLKKNN